MRGDPVRPLLIAAALGLAVGSAVVPLSSAGQRDDLPTLPVLFDDPPTTDAADALIPGDVLLGEEPAEPSPRDELLPQRPRIDLAGQNIEGEPVEADVTIEVTEVEGVPVESSPAEPEESSGRGPKPVQQDMDGDYVPDLVDNCPSVSNVGQEDSDGDGVGDACPVTAAQYEPGPGASDYDGDGIPDESDNCWRLANPSQKDADGDGLGNGCDEGSAPFVIGDANEITGERVVEEPSLTAAGETITPSDPAPTPAPELAEAETGEDGRGGEGGRDRERGSEEGGGEDVAGDDPGAGGDGQGGRRNRNRGQDDGAAVADASGGERQTPVERGERPRRNPDLTEESGPVLPPPRNKKRMGAKQQQVTFVEVVRIDAGALGVRDEKGNRRDRKRDRKANRARTEQVTDARDRDAVANEDRVDTRERTRNRANERQDEPLSDSGAGEAEKPRAATRRAPVPLEEDAVTPGPELSDADERPAENADPGDGPRAEADPRVIGLVPGLAFGWQGGDAPIDAEPGDDAPPATDAEGGEDADADGDGKAEKKAKKDRKRKKERRKQKQAAEAPPLPWSADADYRGGEATLLIDGEDVLGTDADDLYLTQRAGTDRHRNGGFLYAIPVDEDGIYRVRLHFAETWFGAPGGPKGGAGKRVFDVDAEGEEALRDFDIYDEVGAMTAVVKMFDIEVDDGTLELEFLPVKDRPVVSAIEVLRAEEAPSKKDRKQQEKREKRQERKKQRAGQGGAGDGASASAAMPWIDRRTIR